MIRYLVILLIWLWAFNANTEEFPEHRVPDVPTTVLEGIAYKCFDAPQYSNLLTMSSDYKALRSIYLLDLPQTYADIETLYNLKLQLKEDEIVFYKKKFKELQVEMGARAVANEKAQKDLRLSVVGWKIISGIEAVLFVTMTGVAVFK